MMVSINFHVGKYMDSGLYVCDLLYYNTWTCRRCDYDITTNYSGYPENFYDDLSHENEQNRDNYIVNGSDMIVSMLYIKETLSHPTHISFVPGNQYPNISKTLRRE